MTNEELAELLTPAFTKVARRLSGRSQGLGDDLLDADDLLQEGLIAAISARPRWRPDGGRSERDFCFQRGYGAMLDAKRQGASALFYHSCRKHFTRRIAAVVRLSRLPAAMQEDIADRVEPEKPSRAEFVRAVRRLMRGCDVRAAEVAVAQHADGRTCEQIAAGVGVSHSRLFTLMRDAMELVREKYTRHEAAELLGLS